MSFREASDRGLAQNAVEKAKAGQDAARKAALGVSLRRWLDEACQAFAQEARRINLPRSGRQGFRGYWQINVGGDVDYGGHTLRIFSDGSWRAVRLGINGWELDKAMRRQSWPFPRWSVGTKDAIQRDLLGEFEKLIRNS